MRVAELRSGKERDSASKRGPRTGGPSARPANHKSAAPVGVAAAKPGGHRAESPARAVFRADVGRATLCAVGRRLGPPRVQGRGLVISLICVVGSLLHAIEEFIILDQIIPHGRMLRGLDQKILLVDGVLEERQA